MQVHAGIGKGRVFRRRALSQPDDGCGAVAADGRAKAARDRHRFRIDGAERAADRVDQMAFGCVDRRARQMLELHSGGKRRQCAGRPIVFCHG
jgi:hypothetical protein